MSVISTIKITDQESRRQALEVINAVYLQEKNWIKSPENEIDLSAETKKSWFLATVNDKPAGVIRLVYDPSLEFPPELEVTFNQGIDLEKMATECKNGGDWTFYDLTGIS